MIFSVPLILSQGTDEVSEIIDLGGTSLVGIKFPAIMDSTNLFVYGADQIDVSLSELVTDSGSALQIFVSLNRIVMLTAFDLVGIQWIGFKPNSVETVERTIQLITRPVQ